MPRMSTDLIQNFAQALRSRVEGKALFARLQRALPARDVVGLTEDFLGRPGQALPTWLTTQDTSSAGTPTMDFVADAAGGAWAMKPDTTNEVENITLYQGDQLTWNLAKKPILRARVKIEPDVTGAGGAFAAGDKLVIGLASDRNATLDSVVTNAWFRFEGANANILVETDNGTTDTDDKDTGIDWTADTYMELEIDCSTPTAVRFRINGVDRTPSGFTFAVPTSGTVQFFAELQKAAAANNDHRITFDYIDIDAER